MEQVIEVARRLREREHFRGYIHLKTIPDASPELVEQAGRYADRLSINIELPSDASLKALAPEKDAAGIERTMLRIHLRLQAAFACRLQRESGLWANGLDTDRRHLQSMAHQVRREIYAMHAFVRFREVADAQAAGGRRHVAWFEPGHHVLRAVAPFFVKRFAQHPWAILTPRGCLHWDGERLGGAGPARREDAPPADAGEALWLTYYRSIFNPARLKVAAMKRQMEVRYWADMPETRQIREMVKEAPRREGRMRGI